MSSLKEIRDNVFFRNERLNLQKEEAFRKLEVTCGFNNEVNVKITFEELELFKIGERVDVNENVSFEKIEQTKNKLVFLTYMSEGGTFGIHHHDCYEFVNILRGNLFEKTRGLGKVYSEGEMIIYAPNETHIPYATKDSVYEVTFLKELI